MAKAQQLLASLRRPRNGVDCLSVLTYVAVATAASWSVWGGMHILGVPLSLANPLAMLGPALGALALAGRSGIRSHIEEAVDSLSLTRVLEMVGAGYVLVPALVGAGAVFAVSTLHQSWTEAASVRTVVEALTVGMLLALVGAAGEEVGWRGFMFGALRSIGAGKAAVLVGLTWGLWHAPVILLYGYNYHDSSMWGVIAMTAFTVPFSIILCWARLRGASILPAVVIHGSFNALVGVVAIGVTAIDPLLSAPLGLAGILPMAGFAGWLLVTGRLTETQPVALQPLLQPETA